MNKDQEKQKETKTMPVKPLVLVLEETKQELFALVGRTLQNNGLPAYLLEPVVADLHNQLLQAKQQEMQAAKGTYEKQMEEFKEQSAEELKNMEREE